MVKGLDVFRQYFAGHADQFVLIGGTAATLAMEEVGLEFRAMKDLNIVLHIEALRPEFGEVFRRFVAAGRYESRQASDIGKPVLYRFQKPADERFPVMLESSGERLAISEWSLVEFASAAAIKIRTGEITPNLAKQVTAWVQEFAQKNCTVAVPGRNEFRRAGELVGDSTFKLRAGDALHLAIAGSLNARGILCFDDVMIESANLLGINVVTL